jgi:LysM repeat protein
MPGFDGLSLAKHAGMFTALLVLSGCSLGIGDSDEQAVKEVPAQGRQFPVYTVSAPLAPTATPQHATVNSSDESASTETGQAEASANEAGGPDIYVVKSGDSLTSISAALGLTVQDLLELNPEQTDDLIYVGQKLKVASPTTSNEELDQEDDKTSDTVSENQTIPTVLYEVVAGDAAILIAEQFQISYLTLELLNPDVDLSMIYVGQILNVPAEN